MELPEIPPECLDACKKAVEKYGVDKCRDAFNLSMDNGESHISKSLSPTQAIMDKFNVDFSEAAELFNAGSTLWQHETRPEFENAIRNYNEKKQKLPTCPKSGCEGKLHETIAQAEEFNGLYHCESCNAIFKKKQKKVR